MSVMAQPLAGDSSLSKRATNLGASADFLRGFEDFVAAEQRRVFLICLRMLGDRDEADMAAQDSFLKAHRALSSGGSAPPDDASKWITRIAVNTCLDRLRSRSWKFWRRRPHQEDESLILQMTKETSPSAESRVFAGQIGERLEKALHELSDRQRAVFLLRHYEDRKLDEIAAILELDVGTVKAHMARAVARLRGLLKDLHGDRPA
jgi:RNA polymerase sigma-70 factor (ECF subfamily)